MKELIKKLLILTIIATMIVTAMPLTGIDFSNIFIVADATDTYTSGYFEYSLNENDEGESTAWILKYNGNEKNLVIPETIDGNIVEVIEMNCFENNQILESVYLPDTLEAIWEAAFRNCKNLKTVRFPENDIALDNYCFYGCESLEEVTLNLDYGDRWVWGVGEEIFANSGVKKINLAEGITTFPPNLLDGTMIEEIEIPKSVTQINRYAFEKSICELIIVKGVISPIAVGSWTKNATENGRIDKIIYYQPPARSGYGDYYVSRYDSENNYWICEYFIGYGDDEAEEFLDGDFNYGIKENGEAVLYDYVGTETEVVIPETTSKGNPVTEIFEETFKPSQLQEGLELKKVVIPSTVKRIGAEVFQSNKTIEEIVIPDSVEIIGDYAFHNCTSLKSIDYPAMNYIPIGAFSECASLAEFVVPETVEAIGAYAFGSCTSLSSVTLNEGLQQIGYSAFSKARLGNGYPCISEITLPESLEYIGDYAFKNLSVNKITIPAGVKEIRDNAFESSKISELTLNEGLEIIGNSAFFGCTSLENIDFPDTVNQIGNYAFEGCENIKSIEIPPLLTEISKGAFCGILGIESIVIPSTVKVIGESAFDCCDNLKDITIENGVEEIGDMAFSYCAAKELTIPESVNRFGKRIIEQSQIETVYYNAVNYTRDGTVNELNDKTPIFDSPVLKKVVFGDKVKVVPFRFAYKCDTLEDIVFSDSIEKIEGYAFYECSALKKAEFPKNLKEIGIASFINCTSLSEISFSDSIEVIASKAFSNCISLTEITLTENLKEYNHAFDGCTGIKTVNFNAASCEFKHPDATETDGIYYSPFRNLTSLEKINLGENIKELPAYLFCGIETIDEIVLPSTVTDVGVGAFAFSSITSFKASDNLESIEESAFYGCNSLESADLGKNIMLIGAGAFTGCDKLTEIYIPDTVTNIEMEAFENCSALQTVRMSPNVDYIPREAFYNCKELSSFIWDSDSKLVGRLAFGSCVKLVDFDFLNVEKLYVNSFLGSGVAFVQLGESVNEANPTPLTTVEMQSFMDCNNLATLTIGGDVTTIKTQAFADCENLETAVISDSVTEIADDAFEGCDKLTIYCTSGSYVETYALDNNIRVSTLVIAPIANQTYTGKEIKPSINVSYSDESLDKTDYTVSYSNNINIGTAKVTVTGTGYFKYLTSKAGFEIVARKISDAVISGISDREYTGSAITPEINVVYNGITLKKGVDYTVSYSDNTKVGTATVTVKGIGNFKGDAKASFEIVEKGGQSSDNPPVEEPPADNDKTTFNRIIEFLTNSVRAIINALNFIFGLFGFSIG